MAIKINEIDWSLLGKNIREEANDCARLELKYGQIQHACGYVVLSRLADAIERTIAKDVEEWS